MKTWRDINLPVRYDQRKAEYSASSVCFPTSIAIALATMREAGCKMPDEWAYGSVADALLADLKQNDAAYRANWGDKGPMNCRYFGDFWVWYFKTYYSQYFEVTIGNFPEQNRVAFIEQLISSDWLAIVGTVIDVNRTAASGHRRCLWGADAETQTLAISDPWGLDVSVETPDDYVPYDDTKNGIYWKHVDDKEIDEGLEVSWLWSGSFIGLRPKQ